MPQANKLSVSRLVVSHRAAEMAADIAESFYLPFVLVQKNIVIIDPAR
jgi:hypothetical protein